MRDDADKVRSEVERRRTRGWIELFVGAACVGGGMAAAKYAVGFGLLSAVAALIVIGFGGLLVGSLRLLARHRDLAKPTQGKGKTHDSLNLGFGFKSFVAWRYLMARDHRISRIVTSVLVIALAVVIMANTAARTLLTPANPLGLDRDGLETLATGLLITLIVGGVLVYVALLVVALRYIFSFFTTVPLVGVWIGTAALVVVLAVMGGFETDLREKILGSNAHIQITYEDGDFTNWREVKARVDKVPGVVASTPYAVSEVVIAANNNGMPVLIKGIDVETVGKVTNLIDDLTDKEALSRLEPLVDDTRDLSVPDKAQHGGKVVDPPPSDMPGAGEPIDFSRPIDSVLDEPDQPPSIDGAGSGFAEPGPPGPPPPPLDELPLPLEESPPPVGSDYGGDATAVQKPALDPPPPDLVVTDEEPQDFSNPDNIDDDDTIHVIDVPEPSLSRRTQSLPGILVGKELVKQTHLYTGEEVRIVSPLSDPANPDATGTPIPFNRDYRVAGTFYTGMYEYDLKYVYVTLDSLTDFLDRGDVVDGIEVRIGSPDDTDRFVGRLKALLGPKYRVQDWKELNRSLFSALEIEKIAMFLVLGIVILVASFSIIGNLIMVVVEKGREIALIKTLGASDMSVMAVFAIQGLLIGSLGTALGVSTGLLGAFLMKHFGIPLDPDVYYINRMPIHVDFTTVVVIGLAGILISMLATFYPALVAARVRPAAGMRH